MLVIGDTISLGDEFAHYGFWKALTGSFAPVNWRAPGAATRTEVSLLPGADRGDTATRRTRTGDEPHHGRWEDENGRNRWRSRHSPAKERVHLRTIRDGRSGNARVTVPLSGALGRWQVEHPRGNRRRAARRFTQETITEPPNPHAAEIA